jgi:uncharacterized membrane protein YidH (DUF202 family)
LPFPSLSLSLPPMPKRIAALLVWLMNLFDPPPLVTMTFRQKVGRVLLLSGTLVVGSILVAMIGALGLYLMERGRELGSTPEFFNGLVIVLIGVVVNTVCVLALVQIKRVDHKLIPPNPKEGAAMAVSEMQGQGNGSVRRPL